MVPQCSVSPGCGVCSRWGLTINFWRVTKSVGITCNVGGRTIYGIPFANNLQTSELLLVVDFLGIGFLFVFAGMLVWRILLVVQLH